MGRFVKPENILLAPNGYPKLCDVGDSSIRSEFSPNDAQLFTCAAGSQSEALEYWPPEFFDGEKITKAGDWWSLGILLYEMATGLPPFYNQDIQKTIMHILKAEVKFPGNMNLSLMDLTRQFLARDETKRLCDPNKIKGHAFFRPEIDFERL